MRITAIEQTRRGRGYKLYLDGVLALPISREVLQRYALREDDEIADARLDELAEAEARHFALASAIRLLAYKPRTEHEMRERLEGKGVRADIAEATLLRLRELRLIDDAAFANDWVARRDTTSPRGRRLIASELRNKGVAAPLAAKATEGVDDADAAYRAAARRASAMRTLPYAQFRRRLGDLLLRRGFGYETARGTIARLWEEHRGSRAPETEDEA